MRYLIILVLFLMSCDIDKIMGNDQRGEPLTEQERLDYLAENPIIDSAKWQLSGTWYTFTPGLNIKNAPDAERMMISISLTIQYVEGVSRIKPNTIVYSVAFQANEQGLNQEYLSVIVADGTKHAFHHKRFKEGVYYGTLDANTLNAIASEGAQIVDADGTTLSDRSTYIFNRLVGNILTREGIKL